MGRSKAARPTRKQKILIVGAGLIAKDWLVLSDAAAELQIVSRGSGQIRTIKKDLSGGNQKRSMSKGQ